MGGFPNTHEEILKLKGVGPYTAGAVSSIALAFQHQHGWKCFSSDESRLLYF